MPKMKGDFIMIYGYARVSTKAQAKDGNSLEAQERALKDSGACDIYVDAFTGTKTDRPEFDKLMDKIQKGDTVFFVLSEAMTKSTPPQAAARAIQLAK